MAGDLADDMQTRVVQSKLLIATSNALMATTLFRVTRRRRLEGGSDARDGGLAPPAVCVLCNKPIDKPKQSSVTINERAYHSDCWERLERQRARS